MTLVPTAAKIGPSGNVAEVDNAAIVGSAGAWHAAQIVNANVDAAAALAASKFAGYPSDATKVLLGDGTWAVAPTGALGTGTPTSTTVLKGDKSWKNPDYALLSSTVLAVDGSFSVSNIDQTYSDLVIVGVLRSTRVATTDAAQLRFNGDTGGTHYLAQSLQGSGATASAGEVLPAASSVGIATIPAASAGATLWGFVVCQVLGYTSTTWAKSLICHITYRTNTTTGTMSAGVLSAFWDQALAVNALTLFGNVGTLKAGSQLRIYGRA